MSRRPISTAAVVRNSSSSHPPPFCGPGTEYYIRETRSGSVTFHAADPGLAQKSIEKEGWGEEGRRKREEETEEESMEGGDGKGAGGGGGGGGVLVV